MLSLPECHNGGKRHSVQQSERELGGTGNPQVLGVSHIQRDHKPQAHGAPNSRGARVKTAQVHRVPNSTDQPRVRNSTDQPRSMECPIPQTSPGPWSAQFHRPAQVYGVPNSTDQPRSMECQIPQTSPGPCQFHRPAQSAQFHRPAQVHGML